MNFREKIKVRKNGGFFLYFFFWSGRQSFPLGENKPDRNFRGKGLLWLCQFCQGRVLFWLMLEGRIIYKSTDQSRPPWVALDRGAEPSFHWISIKARTHAVQWGGGEGRCSIERGQGTLPRCAPPASLWMSSQNTSNQNNYFWCDPLSTPVATSKIPANNAATRSRSRA